MLRLPAQSVMMAVHAPPEEAVTRRLILKMVFLLSRRLREVTASILRSVWIISAGLLWPSASQLKDNEEINA